MAVLIVICPLPPVCYFHNTVRIIPLEAFVKGGMIEMMMLMLHGRVSVAAESTNIYVNDNKYITNQGPLKRAALALGG
jgi:hypothetical protein